jgi:hypothetical protein
MLDEIIPRLARLHSGLMAADAVIVDINRELLAILARKFTSIGIAGPFSCGKSSLVNGLVGRPSLVPTGRRKETGVPLEFRKADADAIDVHLEDGHVLNVACTRENIERYSSLLTSAGKPNGASANVRQVDVMLHDFPFGPDVRLVDLRGHFDTPDAEPRIAAAEQNLDAILWVSRGDVFLHVREQELVSGFIAAKGRGAVTIVFNALYPNGPWQPFVDETFSRHLTRFNTLPIAKVGGLAASPIPVCTNRMFESADGAAFGRARLVERLLQYEPGQPAIVRSALHRTRDVLGKVRSEIVSKLEKRSDWEKRDATCSSQRALRFAAIQRFVADATRVLSLGAARERAPGDDSLASLLTEFGNKVDASILVRSPVDGENASDMYAGMISRLANDLVTTFLQKAKRAIRESATENLIKVYTDVAFSDARLTDFPRLPITYVPVDHFGINAGSFVFGAFSVAATVLFPPAGIVLVPMNIVGRSVAQDNSRARMMDEWKAAIGANVGAVRRYWTDRCSTMLSALVEEAEKLTPIPKAPGLAPNAIAASQWRSWLAEVDDLLAMTESTTASMA